MYLWRSTQRSSIQGLPLIMGLLSFLFILLVCIMISSSLVTLPGTRVELPTMASVTNVDVAADFIITIAADNSIFFNGKKLNLEELGAELRICLKKKQEAEEQASGGRDNVSSPYASKPMVLVCADKKLTMTQCLEVLDVVRVVGLDAYLVAEIPTTTAPAK